MKAKLLITTDLHKRDVDFSTISGYSRAVDQVQLDLLDCIRDRQVTHMIQCGDWYDKGYRAISRTQNDRNLDEEFKRRLNKNFYMCIGNHFFIERDNNPEMYLIQPHPTLKPTKPVIAFEPVIRTPNGFKIGTVQISLFHFSKESKNYRAVRDADTTFHIGIYHDHTVVPKSALDAAHFPYTDTNSSYINSVLENVDLAIVGHIHTQIGVIKIGVNNRTVPMVIPGSMCITKNDPSEIHTHVDLPLITIEDDNSVKFEFVRFSLHTEFLTFHDRRDAKTADAAEFLQELEPLDTGTPKTFTEFLGSKNYKPNVRTLVEEVGARAVNINDALGILNKEIAL